MVLQSPCNIWGRGTNRGRDTLSEKEEGTKTKVKNGRIANGDLSNIKEWPDEPSAD